MNIFTKLCEFGGNDPADKITEILKRLIIMKFPEIEKLIISPNSGKYSLNPETILLAESISNQIKKELASGKKLHEIPPERISFELF